MLRKISVAWLDVFMVFFFSSLLYNIPHTLVCAKWYQRWSALNKKLVIFVMMKMTTQTKKGRWPQRKGREWNSRNHGLKMLMFFFWNSVIRSPCIYLCQEDLEKIASDIMPECFQQSCVGNRERPSRCRKRIIKKKLFKSCDCHWLHKVKLEIHKS